jgi:hypothetical protein
MAQPDPRRPPFKADTFIHGIASMAAIAEPTTAERHRFSMSSRVSDTVRCDQPGSGCDPRSPSVHGRERAVRARSPWRRTRFVSARSMRSSHLMQEAGTPRRRIRRGTPGRHIS